MMALNLAVKACSKCGQPSSEGFGGGRNHNQCKPCIRAYQHDRYVAQRPERLAYAKHRGETGCTPTNAQRRERAARSGIDERQAKSARTRAWHLSHKEEQMLLRAQKRAAARGMAFDLTLADIVIPNVCPVFGIAIDRSATGASSAASPSLDRIDNTLGYVRGNVAVISMRANQLKRDGTAEEHERVAAWIRTRTREER